MTLKFKWETEFKETEIGEIPKDWKVKSLDEIIESLPGAAFSSKYFNKEGKGLPLIRIRDLGRNSTEAYYDGPYDERYIIKPGDILVGMDGVFDVHKWRGPIGLLNQRVLKIQPKDLSKFDKEYLYYASIIPIKVFEEQVMGTTVSHLLMSHLKFIYLPVPPIKNEQSRIATVLSWFDDLIENKKRQNEILEKVAMAIFKSWFVDFEPFKDEEFVYNEELGKEIPKGWEVKPIGEVAEFYKGISYKGSEKFYSKTGSEKELVFITLDNILRGGGFKINYTWIISERIKKHQLLREGDLIIANTDMTQEAKVIGSPAIVIFPVDYYKEYGVYSHHITKIIPHDEIYRLYLYVFLKLTQDENTTFSTGTNVLGLDIENFKRNKFVLLPPRNLLEKFHTLVEPLFQKIILNQKQIMVLRKIRDALLPKLVFGKIRVVEI